MIDTRVGNPRILSAATAVPSYRVEQGEIKELARRLFAGKFRDLEWLLPVFDNGEILTRHFCQPQAWFGQEWTFPERNALYVEHALALSSLGAALLGLSGYLGGALVYEHGVRVGEDRDGIPGAS